METGGQTNNIISLVTGSGGSGNTTKNGGNGSQMTAPFITVTGGKGEDSTSTGTGGAGGAIKTAITANAGAGGAANTGTGTGGAGGVTGSIYLNGGVGGQSDGGTTAGGVGGASGFLDLSGNAASGTAVGQPGGSISLSGLGNQIVGYGGGVFSMTSTTTVANTNSATTLINTGYIPGNGSGNAPTTTSTPTLSANALVPRGIIPYSCNGCIFNNRYPYSNFNIKFGVVRLLLLHPRLHLPMAAPMMLGYLRVTLFVKPMDQVARFSHNLMYILKQVL